MNQPTKVVNNSVALMGGRLYHAVLNLLAIGLIARYLKLEGFGEYGFIMAVCSIFMVLTDMGINTICIREMSRDLSRANDIFWASSFVKSLFGSVTFLCIALTLSLLTKEKDIVSAGYICGAAVVLFFFGDIFHAVFVAFERMIYVSLLIFVQVTTYLLFVILFIHLDLGLHGIFGALLLSYLMRILAGIFVTFMKFFKPRPRLNPSLCLYLVKEGFPIGVNRIFRKTSFRIDTVLIKMMRSTAEVGIFHGAYRIILVLTLIPQSINQALFPMISRLAMDSRESLPRILEKAMKLLLVIVIPLVASLILFSEYVIRLILGTDFLQAIPALMALCLVWGIMFFNDLYVRFLNACNKQSKATKAVAVCLAVNISADMVLIYLFGYFGAVTATLLAEISLFAMAYHFISKHITSISWKQVIPKPALAGIIMAITMCVLYPLGNLLAFLLGIFVFSIIIYQSGFFDDRETAMIKETLLSIRRGFAYRQARQS